MKIIYSEDHRCHFPQGELSGGELVTPFERPSRVEFVLARLKMRGFSDISGPGAYDASAVARIHDADYIEFLQTAYAEWVAAGFRGEVIANAWPARRMQWRRPDFIDGKAGYYALAGETAITAGTWQAVQSSAAVALTAQKLVQGSRDAAFALCRPPGHHAPRDMYGGYCFLNNAAIAAQAFLDRGAQRIAILDVDFHHGNGTQDIFYDRGDVLFLSLHGEPKQAYPYFLGYEDERGSGEGEGFNVNYALPRGTEYAQWSAALENACGRIEAYGPDALIISLGVDTFKKDPISFFKLESEDFTRYGARIAALKRPTLFVMEGGYAIDEIGINTVNVLEGFLG
ncbi:acetoin utilization deacetylase AcuC-like enzyme [Rhodoligotrophos appendicifer]|uniref:histone deacetylase family protein n=1 Tax=Rhodoligotrophos appendicifer TaxID=987056 RepID=UPI001185983E|nr:histone deacetylase family protein [Rhodoligotrophos appendicifer]